MDVTGKVVLVHVKKLKCSIHFTAHVEKRQFLMGIAPMNESNYRRFTDNFNTFLSNSTYNYLNKLGSYENLTMHKVEAE